MPRERQSAAHERLPGVREVPLGEAVEVFDIAVTDDANGGAFRLRWDETEMVVPFVVR